ncbi:MAG: type I DNA topoisomerase [Firmicutes bacterium]|jgi:DNA topoisomerase-1|nr:type I DNA topoisomerase [Bacillota bacterium]
MGKPLIIVESPAKARTIRNLLGRRYEVKASMGHVRDLPKSQFGVDVEKGFSPKYITIRGKGNVVKDLREGAKKASRVLLATDPDREGEAISWHLAHLLDLDGSNPNRVEFHEITRRVVEDAVNSPRTIDMNLVNAQQARRILDRVVGYKLSPLLWRKVGPGLSAGRVQSVAVRLICDREEEIERFVQAEYWSLTGTWRKRSGDPATFKAKYFGAGSEKREIRSADEARNLASELKALEYSVSSVRRKERRRIQPLPFTTSTLQQEASRKLGFTVRRTMRVAQELYEGLSIGTGGTVGLVTYIRTDSTRVGEAPRKEAVEYIASRYGREYVGFARKESGPKPFVQGAHECIRPTSINREPDSLKGRLTRDQYRLYRLIWERFAASQMSPAVYDTVTVDITGGPHVFRATGSILRFPGFTEVYVEGMDEEEKDGEEALPDLVEGEALDLVVLKGKQHFTQPPPRFTEAMLVKTLEERGIGRPSTYAPIIETIQERGYVVREKKRFKPTPLGTTVVALLRRHFPDIIDVDFTAEMEKALDQVEQGRRDWLELLSEFYGPFSSMLESAEKAIERVDLPEETSSERCELCGRQMVVKRGRYGKFLACPGFPECKNTRPITESTGAKCPDCGREIVVRKSKKGRVFYGCSGYPECRFVSWDKPAPAACPDCGAFLVEKRRKGRLVEYRCSRNGCAYASRPVGGVRRDRATTDPVAGVEAPQESGVEVEY